MTEELDLVKLFGAVSQAMDENQASLNAADTKNHDHGDTMVEIFNTINAAMEQKSSASAPVQLEYASQALHQRMDNRTSNVYADGLAQAAEKFQGQSVTSDNALQLIQTLLGSSQNIPAGPGAPTHNASGEGADMFGSLLQSLMGGETPPPTPSTPASGDDLMGSLLQGLMGGETTPTTPSAPASGNDLMGSLLQGLTGSGSHPSQTDGKLDLNDLVTAGMAFLNAKQQGKSNADSFIQALLAASPLGQSPYQAQSGALVANTMLQAIGALSGK